jgi:hypothetical protein
MKTIEIIEIELDNNEYYTVDKYPKTGFYLVTCKDLSVSKSIIHTNKENNMCMYVSTFEDIKDLIIIKDENVEKEEIEEAISQSLFLRTLAVITKQVNKIDI